jgi:hypothetical protein
MFFPNIRKIVPLRFRPAHNVLDVSIACRGGTTTEVQRGCCTDVDARDPSATKERIMQRFYFAVGISPALGTEGTSEHQLALIFNFFCLRDEFRRDVPRYVPISQVVNVVNVNALMCSVYFPSNGTQISIVFFETFPTNSISPERQIVAIQADPEC